MKNISFTTSKSCFDFGSMGALEDRKTRGLGVVLIGSTIEDLGNAEVGSDMVNNLEKRKGVVKLRVLSVLAVEDVLERE